VATTPFNLALPLCFPSGKAFAGHKVSLEFIERFPSRGKIHVNFFIGTKECAYIKIDSTPTIGFGHQHTVAIVTYTVTKMIATCSPMIGSLKN